MANYQFYGIQSNIMLVASLASVSNIAKAIFLSLAVLYLIGMFMCVRE